MMRSPSMSRRWKMRCMVVLGLVCFLQVPFSASAQDEEVPLSEISASGLLTKAGSFLESELYDASLPYLHEYLERMKDSEDDRVIALMQDVRFKLGKIMIALEDSAAAAKELKAYLAGQPVYKWRQAMKLTAVSLYELGEYEECVVTVTNAFFGPPEVEKKEEEKVDVDKLSEEDLGGLSKRQLKRIEKYAEEAEGELFEFDSSEPDPEPEYSTNDLVLLNMTLGQACTELGEWELSIDPYKYVIANAEEEERKGFAIMQLVTSLIELERFVEVRTLVLDLYKTNAKYDIRVNLALMNAAGALVEAEEYDSALMMYRMVLSRKDLVAYQVEKMNEIRADEGLPEVEMVTVTNDTGRVQTLFGNKRSGPVSEEIVGEDGAFNMAEIKPMELVVLEERAGMLMSLPPYEDEVLYRTGQLYAKAGRPWEAVALLSTTYERDLEGLRGQQAFYETLQVLTDPLKEYARVEKEAIAFLDAYTEGVTPRQIAYQLTACYQIQNKMKEIKTVRPYIEGFDMSTDRAVLQYDCELWYMQAIADLMLMNYDMALSGFEKVLEEYKGFHQMDNATYWHAMCQLFIQKYEQALAEFQAYLNNFPDGNWADACTFRSGLCFFGLEKYDEAQAAFAQVIEQYPESSVYPDACSLRGDLLASKGMLNEAQADYEEAIRTAGTPRQDAYAVFQMASMFELEARWTEIIEAVNGYKERHGENADVAKAAFWIGKTKLAQGLVDEAVEEYRKTVITYGDNIEQDGVDLIISELVTVTKRLPEEDMMALKASLSESLNEAESETLKLRLRVLLATIDKKGLELGAVLIDELKDLTQAPPPVLSLICQASFEQGDYSRSEEILTLFLNHFEESDYVRAAYKLRGYDLFEQAKYAEAMEIIKETQALYGTERDAAWAQLMKGRIELEEALLATSYETFRAVLNVRDWRGSPYAEAIYYLGAVEEKSGNLRDAFGWYQRCYFQYRAHAGGRWAADAYIASARCLLELGLMNDMRNTYRAMLFDRYVNQLPQADIAREFLGADEVIEITTLINQGVTTNISVSIEEEVEEEAPTPAEQPDEEAPQAEEAPAPVEQPGEEAPQAAEAPQAEETLQAEEAPQVPEVAE